MVCFHSPVSSFELRVLWHTFPENLRPRRDGARVGGADSLLLLLARLPIFAAHIYIEPESLLVLNRPRRTNGATQTFRRPSLATNISSSNSNQNHPRESGQAPQPGVYVPPHRNGSYVDTRYSKNQLLDLFRFKQESDGALKDGLASLYMAGWEPSTSNGASASGWNRRDEQAKEHAPGPEVCWDRDGATAPISLLDMSDEEREVRSVGFTDHHDNQTKNPASFSCLSTRL